MNTKNPSRLLHSLRRPCPRSSNQLRYSAPMATVMRNFTTALVPHSRLSRSAASRSPHTLNYTSSLQRIQTPSIFSYARHESNNAPPGSTFKSAGPSRGTSPVDKPGPYEGVQIGTRDRAPIEVPAPKTDSQGEVPAYELTFTCKPCLTRSTHRISKHGYHNGTVLITCPQCKNRHVITDHLKIFNDSKKSFEDILAEKGLSVKTGVLDPDGDIELWDDGSQSSRAKSRPEDVAKSNETEAKSLPSSDKDTV